ncbi:MAG: hypothetical protein N5P05_001111 [Chroococcopsis gigantea SAG 12.99]|jgi:hypothetical protein|nr:low-complexity tail membrane protein [Chlorogloea purpurea SAG 13.99]MDV2999505.1 hypothetical protein [Chroococcopsis gigantea SAG 12.99]
MRSEPFLWIHLAGIAAVPLFLQVAWLGLAIGSPLPLIWLEYIFLAAIAVIPVLWMQWSRPFDIFSLLVVALKPGNLTPEQLKILALFRTPKHKLITLLGAVLFLGLAYTIYQIAPLAASKVAFLPQWRLLGLSIAGVGFLSSHLFLQVPLGVLGVLSTKPEKFNTVEPIPAEVVPALFSVLGFKVNKIGTGMNLSEP